MKTTLALFILGLILITACKTAPQQPQTVSEPTPLDQPLANLDQQPSNDINEQELTAMDKNLDGLDQDIKDL